MSINMRQNATRTWKTFLFLMTGQAILIAAGLGLLLKDNFDHFPSNRNILALGVNLASSAAAIVLGGTTFVQLNPDLATAGDEDHAIRSGCSDMTSQIILTGTTAYTAFEWWSPAYSSPWQILAYLCATILVVPDRSWLVITNWGCFIITYFHWSHNNAYSRDDAINHGRAALLQYESQGHNISRCRDALQTCSRVAKSIRLTGFLCSAIPWLLFLYANFQSLPGLELKSVPILDTDYTASSQLDIVVSMYEEEPETVRHMMLELTKIPIIASSEVRLIVYSKQDAVDTTKLKAATGADRAEHLQNRGREGETYLHHILNRWDDLGRHTIFLQAGIHNPREFYARIRNYFVPTTGMLSLGFSGNICNCNTCGDRWGWTDLSGVIPRLYADTYHKTCDSTPILLSYKGQFIASAARIRGNDRGIYKRLHEALIDRRSWAHQEPYLQGRPDSLNAPLFGYTLERLWSMLLQCSDLDVAFKCPTMLSRTRRWGGIEDCQCLDWPSNVATSLNGEVANLRS